MKRMKSYEELSRPLRPGSPEALYWAAVDRVARAIAPLSTGMSLGYRHGFDSGPMLDYVYQNRASGRLVIGKLLDRAHLNAIGWRGIRQRKRHLQQLLREVIGRLRAQRSTLHPAMGPDGSVGEAGLHIVDIASGPGRYLLELLEELRPSPVTATLRDWDATGLEQGRALAQSLGLTSVRFERGDAFDPQALAAIRPRPQAVVVSGFYELFPDNALIRRSLSGLSQLMEPGSVLVYTNQPYHPQLELIARCLPNREGKPWAMRLRAQAEMDGLVREAGFHPEKTLTDRWGIFTVTAAVKTNSFGAPGSGLGASAQSPQPPAQSTASEGTGF